MEAVPKDSCALHAPRMTAPLQPKPRLTPDRFSWASTDTKVNSSNVGAYVSMLGDVQHKAYMQRHWYLHHTLAPFLVWWLSQLQHSMGIFGAVGEIGVQYGGFFLAIATSSAMGEQPYAIDIFDRQRLNVDGSGRGAWKQFSINVEALSFKPVLLRSSKLDGAAAYEPTDASAGGRRRRTIVAIRSLSTELTSSTLGRLLPQPTRLISVDGGHSRASTCHDLNLAAAHLHEGGIVILDDVGCCEKEHTWGLGVIDGLAAFYAGSGRDALVPFFYFFPKLYLATPKYARRYRLAMQSDPLLNVTLRFDLGNAELGDRGPIQMHSSRFTLFGGEVLRAGTRPAEVHVRDAWLKLLGRTR